MASAFMPVGNADFYPLLFVVISSLCIAVYIFGVKSLPFGGLVFLGFLLRLFLMFADYYKWFPIINSGLDSEGFHQVALANQTSVELASNTNYTYFLTLVYYITGSSRMIAQYLNVLFGVGVMVIVQRCLAMLNISKKTGMTVMLVVVLLPNLIIFSGILLREAWVEFFVSASVLCFLYWFRDGRVQHIIGVVVCVLCAAWMHSAVIGLLAGYIVAFITYCPRSGRVQFSGGTIISLILLSGMLVVFMGYANLFTGKFAKLESQDDLFKITNRISGGGSDYLTWISVESVTQGLLFSPLKMFYFLFSPLPTEWRGVQDVLGFVIDGAVYLWLCIMIFGSKCAEGVPRLLKRYLIVSLLVTTFIFAYGTTNAGTAFRHRAKLFSLIAVTYVVSVSFKQKNN